MKMAENQICLLNNRKSYSYIKHVTHSNTFAGFSKK